MNNHLMQKKYIDDIEKLLPNCEIEIKEKKDGNYSLKFKDCNLKIKLKQIYNGCYNLDNVFSILKTYNMKSKIILKIKFQIQIYTPFTFIDIIN